MFWTRIFFLAISCFGIELAESPETNVAPNIEAFLPKMDEMVYGLLHVAKYHSDQRVAAGAVFLAGLQSSKYLMTVAANVLMRYAVTNGSMISLFGDPRKDTRYSDREFNKLLDAMQIMIDERYFNFVIPAELRNDDLERTESVRLFKDGFNLYVRHTEKSDEPVVEESVTNKESAPQEDPKSEEYLFPRASDSIESSKLEVALQEIDVSSEGSGGEDDVVQFRDLSKRPRQPRSTTIV